MDSQRLVEIRSYELKPGTQATFHALVSERSVPLLRAAQMDVVAFGPCVHDANGYVLIRAYDSVEHLQTSQDAFYASDAWRQGPREAIVACIERDANATLWLAASAVEAIRLGMGPAGAKVASPR